MKYAVLADIHSNILAFEAVLSDLNKKGTIDEIWCLGDIVGYGPDPHECIDLLKKLNPFCVAGNHDWAATGKIDISDFNPEAAEAIHWTKKHLTSDDIKYLDGLPLTLEKGDFTLVHGSPREPIWEYIISEEAANDNFKYFSSKYCLVGHSHLPLLFVYDDICLNIKLSSSSKYHSKLDKTKTNNSSNVREPPSVLAKIKLRNGRLIINPGSVGQPRDNDPRASYAIYDRDSSEIIIYRVEYDILGTQERMRNALLPFRLIRRLKCGE
jgi:predicted phosphodiesterase